MAEIEALRSLEFSTNLELLSQQLMPKVAMNARMQSGAGSKAFRMLSQIDETAAQRRTTRAKPAINIDVEHDGRWVYPTMYDWGKVVDDIDLLQTNIAPQGAYVRSAIAALNRTSDDNWFEAFFGPARTGESGNTTVNFDTNNVVAVDFGGSSIGLTVPKLRKAMRILRENEVDTDMEEVFIAVTPEQHDDLLGVTQVTSTDFNRPTLIDGRIDYFMGMRFIISNRIPLDSNGHRRVPVWVRSGMGRGVWKEVTGEMRKRPDLQGNPDYIEASKMDGYSRLEEAKCVEVKCDEE